MWRQVLIWLAALRRLYPVSTSTLKFVVCFLCHNSKGKAKCAIILMDFEMHRSWGSSDCDSEGGKGVSLQGVRFCHGGSIAI
jgi:N-acetylmuramoyl-L-alanine amidase